MAAAPASGPRSGLAPDEAMINLGKMIYDEDDMFVESEYFIAIVQILYHLTYIILYLVYLIFLLVIEEDI